VDVTVTPSSLTLAPGAKGSFTVTFTTNSSATFGAYTSGHLTWTDGSHVVRSPIVVRPVRLSAPAEVSGTGTTGSKDISVRFGYTGSFGASPQGLVAAVTKDQTVNDDPTNDFNTDSPAGNQGITVTSYTIPAGTSVARWETFSTNHAGDDIDMYVYKVSGSTRTLVGLSGSGSPAEQVTVRNPDATATYEVYIHGWEVTAPAAYTLYSWLVPSSGSGNLTVSAPTTATNAASATVTAAWSGLTAGTKYMGRVSYTDGTNEIGGTIVRVDG
jgi:hypothetical protein